MVSRLELRPHPTEVVDLAGGLLAPGFVDAHVHPIQGGLERLRCDLSEQSTREEYLATIAAYADAHPDVRLDPRRRLGDGGLPGRHADGGRPRRGRAGPAGVPAQPRPPRRVGQHAARWSSPGSTRDTPDPADGRIERDADGHPSGTLHEGAMSLVVAAPAAGPPARTTTPALLAGQALPALARRHRLAGRDRRRLRRHGRPWPDLRRRRPRAATSLARRRRAVVGAAAAASEQVADLVGRRERCTGGRFRATTVKIMQDGVAENFTAAMLDAVPRPVRPRDRQPRALVRRPRRAAGRGGRAGRRGLPGARPRDRRPRRARGAGRVRAAPTASPPPPHRAPAAGAPRRRAALRRARRRRQHAGAVGLPTTSRWSS